MNIDKAIAKEHTKIAQALLRLQILHAQQHAEASLAAWGISEESSLDEMVAAAAKLGFTIRTGGYSGLALPSPLPAAPPGGWMSFTPTSTRESKT